MAILHLVVTWLVTVVGGGWEELRGRFVLEERDGNVRLLTLGRCLPVQALVPLVMEWLRERFGSSEEGVAVLETLHAARKCCWTVERQDRPSGAREYALFYEKSRSLVSYGRGGHIHVSMNGLLNEGFEVPMMDLAPLLARILHDYKEDNAVENIVVEPRWVSKKEWIEAPHHRSGLAEMLGIEVGVTHVEVRVSNYDAYNVRELAAETAKICGVTAASVTILEGDEDADDHGVQIWGDPDAEEDARVRRCITVQRILSRVQ